MTAADTITALMAGRPEARSRLLNSVSCEAFGLRAYGREAVTEFFRTRSRPLSPQAEIILGNFGLAVFDSDESGRRAVIADVFGEHLARLWMVGDTEARSSSLKGTRVPFDPDMSQVARQEGFRPQDHPELNLDVAPAIRSTIDGWLHNRWEGAARSTRAFVVRALSADNLHVVLAAIHKADPSVADNDPWYYVGLLLRSNQHDIVHESIIDVRP